MCVSLSICIIMSVISRSYSLEFLALVIIPHNFPLYFGSLFGRFTYFIPEFYRKDVCWL